MTNVPNSHDDGTETQDPAFTVQTLIDDLSLAETFDDTPFPVANQLRKATAGACGAGSIARVLFANHLATADQRDSDHGLGAFLGADDIHGLFVALTSLLDRTGDSLDCAGRQLRRMKLSTGNNSQQRDAASSPQNQRHSFLHRPAKS